ncbi:MAG: hypothetical protein AABO41_16685 [Acidobacteriota bacterium]
MINVKVRITTACGAIILRVVNIRIGIINGASNALRSNRWLELRQGDWLSFAGLERREARLGEHARRHKRHQHDYCEHDDQRVLTSLVAN